MNAIEPQNRMSLTKRALEVINSDDGFYREFGIYIDPRSNTVPIFKATPPVVKFRKDISHPDEKVWMVIKKVSIISF